MRPILAALLIVALLVPFAYGDDFNVTRLARVDDYVGYNDIWGYTAPDGREYAILGEKDGTLFYNATDPVNPVEVAYIPGSGCLWRDIKTYQNYAYIVNDCIGGVQVVDLSDPENPLLVNEIQPSYIGHSHNVQIDTDAGKLYAVGTSKGMVIYDLAVNPVNPPRIKTWNGQGLPNWTDGYVHDLHVQNGKAHLALISDGIYALMDVSSLPSTSIISCYSTPEDFTHSTWVNEAETLLVTADETTGTRNLIVKDLTSPGGLGTIAELGIGTFNIPHNPFIDQNDILHVSYYELGYLAWDLSDTQNVVQIGSYDTTPNDNGSGFFNGAWGVYPFQPSGFVYVSDMGNGLQILKRNQCDPSGTGAPALCEVWPEEIQTGAAPQTILLTGADYGTATTVHLGGTALSPSQFTALDEQVISLTLPTQTHPGLIPVTVVNGSGFSETGYINVVPSSGPELVSLPGQPSVGDHLSHALTSQAGDTHFLALSFTPQPSELAGKVSFGIGNNFTDFLFLAPLATNGQGKSAVGPIVVPAGAVGLQVFWQFAALDGVATMPVPVSNVTLTDIQN
ncbi:MAG: choice-of-anchor B family protein [Planctomycetota bacterium]|nr:choice-of-anchor B family protein [Planctomycetota bacterium]